MCTMKVMLSVALLAVSVIYIASADTGKNGKCCMKASRGKPRPPVKIESFFIQEADPPCVAAVMFITNNKNEIICADPNTPWVKKKVEELRKKEEENKTN